MAKVATATATPTPYAASRGAATGGGKSAGVNHAPRMRRQPATSTDAPAADQTAYPNTDSGRNSTEIATRHHGTDADPSSVSSVACPHAPASMAHRTVAVA